MDRKYVTSPNMAVRLFRINANTIHDTTKAFALISGLMNSTSRSSRYNTLIIVSVPNCS